MSTSVLHVLINFPRAMFVSTVMTRDVATVVQFHCPTQKLGNTAIDVQSIYSLPLLFPLPRLFQKNSLWVTFATIKIISKPSNLGVAFARLGRLTTAITEDYRHVPSIEGLSQFSFLPHPV